MSYATTPIAMYKLDAFIIPQITRRPTFTNININLRRLIIPPERIISSADRAVADSQFFRRIICLNFYITAVTFNVHFIHLMHNFHLGGYSGISGLILGYAHLVKLFCIETL